MDFEEHVFQVSATFTPLQEVEVKGAQGTQFVNETTNKLMQTPASVNISKFLKWVSNWHSADRLRESLHLIRK